MSRFLYSFGWLLALGLGGWLLAIVLLVVFEEALKGNYDPTVLVGMSGAVVGGTAGLLIARATWRSPRVHGVLVVAGALLGAGGLVRGIFFFVASEAIQQNRPATPLAGLWEFLLGLVGMALAAIGVGLLIAGLSGRAGQVAMTQSAPHARAGSSRRE